MNLIDRMQAHRDAGGSLFDCPSFIATPEEKAELYRATNALFNDTFKDCDFGVDHLKDEGSTLQEHESLTDCLLKSACDELHRKTDEGEKFVHTTYGKGFSVNTKTGVVLLGGDIRSLMRPEEVLKGQPDCTQLTIPDKQ